MQLREFVPENWVISKDAYFAVAEIVAKDCPNRFLAPAPRAPTASRGALRATAANASVSQAP